MTALAEAYIHLRHYQYTTSYLNEIQERAERIARPIIAGLYTEPVDLEIRIEEGSLKIWLTVFGVLGAAYHGIAVYSEFKKSITELVKDAREFSDSILDDFLPEINATPPQIYRTERRLKTPGKIHRIINRVEKLKDRMGGMNSQDVEIELNKILGELYKIQKDLSEEEIKFLLSSIEIKTIELPKTPKQLKERVAALRQKHPEDFDLLEVPLNFVQARSFEALPVSAENQNDIQPKLQMIKRVHITPSKEHMESFRKKRPLLIDE
ncbi:hypothetical protein V6B08_04365 [Ferrovibrio sp. MS7]|uniref:hypothetical protein n=1 Tax=Ferrovibrio plantarum TaxID=3119164 RepID=UPI0031368CFD